MTKCSALIMIGLLITACDGPHIPKPRAQLRIDLPEHEYRDSSAPCPFQTQVSAFSQEILRKNDGANCWIDLRYPKQNATLHLTYKPVHDDLKILLEEAHGLTYEHHIIADGIGSRNFVDTLTHVNGTLYEVSGEVASNTQFYLTDSTKHFLRGALYFNCAPNEDSLAPVTAFIREDVVRFIEALEWRD
jgi:gliding motility-associated lipoprotein GldD